LIHLLFLGFLFFVSTSLVERSCVGDNRRHLQTELAVGFAVAFEVFERVFEFDAVVFQEGVDLHTGLEAEELTQQGCGDFARAVGFESEGFQGGAGEVLALGGEGCEEFVWKRDGDVLHGFRIPEESVKSTARASKVKTPTLTKQGWGTRPGWLILVFGRFVKPVAPRISGRSAG
jgi:hypothetical protein